MTPAAAVSGIYLAHPLPRYFSVGRLGRDQVEDYAARKGMSLEEAERWLPEPRLRATSSFRHRDAFGQSAPSSRHRGGVQLVSPKARARAALRRDRRGGGRRARASGADDLGARAAGVRQRVGTAIDAVRIERCGSRDERVVTRISGTHTSPDQEHQEISEAPRYQRLVEGLQWVAKRVAIFGLHVHVGIDEADRSGASRPELSELVPKLLALSTNSPNLHGRDTGLSSTRSQIFDTMPHQTATRLSHCAVRAARRTVPRRVPFRIDAPLVGRAAHRSLGRSSCTRLRRRRPVEPRSPR